MSLWKKFSAVLGLVCLVQTLWLLSTSDRGDYEEGAAGKSTQTPRDSVPPSFNMTLWRYYQQILIPPTTDVTNERLTILMPTYKRADILPSVIKHYCSMGDSVEKILVIWNDVETPIPPSLHSLRCDIDVLFIVSKENKLTNRFMPRDEIETKGVLVVDDDRLISGDDVQFGFQIWKQFRHRIIGFEHRMHTLNQHGDYHYGPYPKAGQTPEKLGYSMLISASFILHRVYLELFHSSYLPGEIMTYINREMNCEDVAMCILVAQFLRDVAWPQSSVISVKPRVPLKNLEATTGGGHRGLSNQLKHYNKRSECLNKFAAAYGGRLPLQYITGRMYREPIKPWYNFKLQQI
ncbi:PREDICTED: exostosin-like 2 [Amphimedon queenslandica]|uniref:Glycosyl transferase 64 domain-containing protein n=1 Tax=Amphimedon queenslandica TaxID=400682 RepID=A0A1X7UFW7_AMPQE|nr:PREDICTED: exostosin-like 2 [Amphimedon queenslandica]|eukprot:XP_011405217.2 PREDICTED: exostosin-like 2 [Amphimedon queenslandica]